MTDQPNTADDRVYIWSGEHRAWWNEWGAGYVTNQSKAGIWPRSKAEQMTSICGPEKKIELQVVK